MRSYDVSFDFPERWRENRIGRRRIMHRKGRRNRIPGEVRFYAGHRGREEPKQIILRGRVFPVTSLLSRERVEGGAPGCRHEVFLCRIAPGTIEVRVREDGAAEIFADPDTEAEVGS
jgi:hypothetical protein